VELYSVDAFEEKLAPLVQAAGGVYRPIPTDYGHLSAREAENMVLPGGAPGRRLTDLVDEMGQYLIQSWQRDDGARPDVAVVDFLTASGVTASQAASVPLVLNLPGPVDMLRQILCLPDPSSAVTVLGFTVITHRFSALRLLSRLAPVFRSLLSGLYAVADRCPILVNSFRGFEKPGLLPHNWILTGPLSQPPAELLDELRTRCPNLHEWMEAAREAGRPVVYVSTGSIHKLGQWEVRTLAEGLARVSSAAVVWSLPSESRDFFPTDLNSEQWKGTFWVSAWLPQPAILAHPATKLVITHCGWGGTMEVIATAQPVLALPFKADQPMNAALLVSAGAAVMLPKKQVGGLGAVLNVVEGMRYGPHDFSAQSIADDVCHIFRNYEVFKAAARRLQRQAAFSGGSSEAADCIEWVGRAGCEASSVLWDNPALRRCQGGWVELLIWPAVGIGAAAVALYWCAGIRANVFSCRALS
jgi:hypothetical protein